ncbi:hypothetical protein F0562_003636 [Nyssa sinensis]|uniref:EF-hand domain-containing protein n=1 Tax=Nyssa sinensis TaxID=561372 RepID=A0A5J5BWI6_9ASTE|nr:hypothetical protein F0562_003636 [Nyssa sinensis]
MAIISCIQVQPNREMSLDEFQEWLRRFDTDQDGRISREELKEALHSLRIWFGWWKARQGMKEADTDHTGHIDNAKEIEKLDTIRLQKIYIALDGQECSSSRHEFTFESEPNSEKLKVESVNDDMEEDLAEEPDTVISPSD